MTEDTNAEQPDEANEALEALKDIPHRIPNRRMLRDMERQVGQIRSQRPRIRRRVYRVRRYYEDK